MITISYLRTKMYEHEYRPFSCIQIKSGSARLPSHELQIAPTVEPQSPTQQFLEHARRIVHASL